MVKLYRKKIIFLALLVGILLPLTNNTVYGEPEDFPEFFNFDLANFSEESEFDDFPEFFNFEKPHFVSHEEFVDVPEILNFYSAKVSSFSLTPGNVVFEGEIHNSENNPISDIEVYIHSNRIQYGDISNSQGQFSFDIIPGEYHLHLWDQYEIDYPNLPERFEFSAWDSMTITTDTVQNLTLPNVSLDVTVLDFEGNPVSGSSITATGYELRSNTVTQNGEFSYYFFDSGTTDASGKTQLDLFSSSKVEFVVMPPPESDLPFFSVSMPVTEDSHITLQFPTPVKFEGTISDSGGSQVSDIEVYIHGGGSKGLDFSNSQGQFLIEIIPGEYHLHLQDQYGTDYPNLPDQFHLSLLGRMQITTDTVQNLTLPNVSLDVTVLDFEGNPVSGSSIDATGYELGSTNVSPDLAFNYNFNDSSQTDNLGNATIDVFQSSKVNFLIRPPEGSDLFPFWVSMPISEDSHLTFQFPTPVKFEGTISNLNETPISNVNILLFGSGQKEIAVTDSQGKFSLDLFSGDFSLKINSRYGFNYLKLPEKFGFDSVDEISITRDTIENLTLPNVSLDITILDFEGNPVSGSSVTATGNEYSSQVLNSEIEFNYSFSDGGQTNDSGKTKLDLLQASNLWVTIIPPKDSGLKPLIQSGLSFLDDGEITFVLQSKGTEDEEVSQDGSVFDPSSTAFVSVPRGTSVPGCETTNECFTPYHLKIIKGASVLWSNDDSAAHTVTAGSASQGPSGFFDSSLFMAGTTFSHQFNDLGSFEYFCMVHPWMEGIVSVIEYPIQAEPDDLPENEDNSSQVIVPSSIVGAIPSSDDSSGDNQWDTRPTFGVSHELREGQIVENGFSFNTEHFTLTENHHTNFLEQTIDIGTTNSFSATVYADKKLKVQEFLFGVPNVGASHLAELGVEVWYDTDGNINDVKVIQKSDVIDETTLVVNHAKTKCLSSDKESKCDTTTISMKFLEPLQDKVMAIKAIDFKNRDQRTYLNDGFDISGASLNPMNTKMIPSTIKNEGLLKVSQMEKYSPYWKSDDGRIFEKNDFESFSQVNKSFERFQDTGNPYTRLHSEFGKIVTYEQKRALDVFNSSELISKLPESFGHDLSGYGQRMTPELEAKMLEEERSAKIVLKKSDKQTRW